MKNKKGFTLVELLSVIVILSVILLITIPVIKNIIDRTKKEAFEASVKSAISAANLKFSSSDKLIQENHIDVTTLNLKNNSFKYGFITKNESNKLEVINVSDGFYCANGTLENMTVYNGECDIAPPSCSITPSVISDSWINKEVISKFETSTSLGKGLTFSLTVNGDKIKEDSVTFGNKGKIEYKMSQSGVYILDGYVKSGSELSNTCSKTIKIDIDLPQLVEIQKVKNNLTFKATDNVGIIGYSLTLEGEKPIFNDVTSIKSYSGSINASNVGTYYLYIKDEANNVYKSEKIEFVEKDFHTYSLDKKEYTSGTTISWAGKNWIVLTTSPASQDSVLLILKDNYKTGIYSSSSTTFEGSTAYNEVNTTFVNTYTQIKDAINENSLVEQGTYNNNKYYVRLPLSNELKSGIGNNTYFWTKSVYSGTNMHFGSPSGTIGSKTTATGTKYYNNYYQIFNESISDASSIVARYIVDPSVSGYNSYSSSQGASYNVSSIATVTSDVRYASPNYSSKYYQKQQDQRFDYCERSSGAATFTGNGRNTGFAWGTTSGCTRLTVYNNGTSSIYYRPVVEVRKI